MQVFPCEIIYLSNFFGIFWFDRVLVFQGIGVWIVSKNTELTFSFVMNKDFYILRIQYIPTIIVDMISLNGNYKDITWSDAHSNICDCFVTYQFHSQSSVRYSFQFFSPLCFKALFFFCCAPIRCSTEG